MRNFLSALCLVILLLATAGLQAAPIDDFLAFNERFYCLDRQAVGTITARLECPMLIASMNGARTQLEKMKKAIAITGDPADYTLTYHPKNGLKLNPPMLKVEQISEEGIKDPAAVKQGLEQMRGGLQQQLDGIVQTLEAVFQGFSTPNPKDYSVQSVTQTDGVWSLKFANPQGSVVGTFTGTVFDKIESGNGSTVRSHEEYKAGEDGKLLLQKALVVVENSMMTVEVTFDMGYEKVGGIAFPSSITSTFNQKTLGMEQKGKVELFLKDLAIKKD